VLVYLEEAQVKAALAQIALGLPGATIALDTGARRAVDSVNRDHERRGVAARFAWACEDPRASLWFFGRFFPKAMSLYRLNLFVAR
jgi:O-methyltransferase involved in polyketide biosynthesis